jgi:hypothetical protein
MSSDGNRKSIRSEVLRRGITRICHFTPSHNLPHILADGSILPTKRLKEDVRAVYNPNDLLRLDGYEDHVCCSIEYPNAWYFEKARQRERVFTDWVVILIDPSYLWLNGTLFSPRNASAGGGAFVQPGIEGFRALYRNSVWGAYGKHRKRSAVHLTSCPTDEQAEILVADSIGLNAVIAIAVAAREQADSEFARLRMLGYDAERLKFVVADTFYSPHQLSDAIRSGRRPAEEAWFPQMHKRGRN